MQKMRSLAPDSAVPQFHHSISLSPSDLPSPVTPKRIWVSATN